MLRVKPGLNSLRDAVEEAKKKGITDIYLLNGTHDEKRRSVIIDYSVSIVGESREHCIVMGGLRMKGKKEDDINVSNLTLRDSKWHGVDVFEGASIHLDNVSVENSEGCGVVVWGTKRSTMKNCNVSHSRDSGLFVGRGGLMSIDGNDTTIQHNCTKVGSEEYNEDYGEYGLFAGSSASILLASSLQIEMISTMNEGGGDYGGRGTIAIVDNGGTIIETIQEPFFD